MSRNTEEYLVKKMPYDFWNYGINPILGYRYQPDGKGLPNSIRSGYIKVNERTTTK